jgi:DNA-binding GntR family transcriptional regulator
MGNKLMAHEGNLDTLVRESLRHKIMSGEMEGGYHLSELKISKDYSVSRTPVREALCALAADGLVEMVPHRGAFVTHTNTQSKTDQLRAYGLFTGLAAKLAAENANIEMLMDLETAFSFAQAETTLSAEVYQNAIETALEMLEKTAGSAIVSEALSMVSRRTNTKEIWGSLTAAQQGEFNNQFNLLMAALKRKKPDAAEKTMRQIAIMATSAYLSQRKSASAADSVTSAMGKQFAKETPAAVN